MKAPFLCGLAAALLLYMQASAAAVVVQRVIDGDTVVLEGGERVRLLGVDTPELKHPLAQVRAFAREASDFTRREIEGKNVRLEYDWDRKDHYGRTLAYVYREPDGFFLNVEIIKQGYGFAYTRFPFKFLEDFRAAERAAREGNAGLWSDAGFPNAERNSKIKPHKEKTS